MVLKDVLRHGINILKEADIRAPVADAGVLLCAVLNQDRTFLYAHGDYILSEGEKKRYLEFLDKRVHGMPLQYITGHQEFMSIDFAVTPDVLIPRHETEILVEMVIRYVESKKPLMNEPLLILDMGTGSGCVAVSLARYIENCRVTAVDISNKALEVAKINAKRNKVFDRMDFLCGDLFAVFNPEKPYVLFDAIVSNPPYIPSKDVESLQVEVRDCEPIGALDGGADGLDFYRALVQDAPGFLKPGGLLAFEAGYGQAGEVCKIMEGKFSNICIYKDLSGIDRVVSGTLNSRVC